MLLKGCPRCGNLIPYGMAYCDKCTPIVEAERQAYIERSKKAANKRYNRTRDPKYIQFYNSKDWRILSAKYTQDHEYKCELCGKIATEVHHIEPIQSEIGWRKRLDYDNLELLCVDCHNKRHNRFRRRERSKQ